MIDAIMAALTTIAIINVCAITFVAQHDDDDIDW